MVTLDIRTAWTTIENALSIKDVQNIPGEERMLEAAHVLEVRQLGHIISEWFFESFQRDLHDRISARFWRHFQAPVTSTNLIPHVCEAIKELYDHLADYTACFGRLSTIQTLLQPDILGGHKAHVNLAKARAQLMLKAIIFSHTTKHFQDAFHNFYFRAFRAFDTTDLDDLDEVSEDEEPIHCLGCDEERENCCCKDIIQGFHTVNKQLRELGLLERLSGGPVSALINQRIRHHVEHTCKGNFETPYLSQMEQWLESKVVGWLDVLYSVTQPSTPDAARTPSPILPHPHDASLDQCMDTSLSSPTKPHVMDTPSSREDGPMAAHKDRLYHYLYSVYADIRVEQLFNIIVEYPDSEPALLDLRICLEKTDRRSKLVTILRNELETRLLHPGVNTGDILTAYVSAIRALRVLDHTGVLLELVCEPVRKYLRTREDTVRRIVSDLTGDSGNELSDELIKGQPLVLDNSYLSDEDNSNWESWQPDPIDADPSRVSASRRTSDIISMLVNIYGSKELFVNEYRTLLADRLLAHFHSATEREIRNLELLKLRFGEQQLHYCEVMLKDVADSKRINSHITDRRLKEERLKATPRPATDTPASPTPSPTPSENVRPSTSHPVSLQTPDRAPGEGDALTTPNNYVRRILRAARSTDSAPTTGIDTMAAVGYPITPDRNNVRNRLIDVYDEFEEGSDVEKTPDNPRLPGGSGDQDEDIENRGAGKVDIAATAGPTDKKEEIPVTAMILSAQFWPTFREEKLHLPQIMQTALDKYTGAYETLKGNRTLCWKNHLGLVSLEIELKDGRKLNMSVSPVHATIIWHFQEKSQWTVEELSNVMQMPTSAVRRKMALWQSHGLLREDTPDTFVLSEDAKGRGHNDVIMDEDEAESAMASASDQREEELQVLWSYIVGMLTNLESLPLERIHSMLKMFMLQSPTSTEVGLPELKSYLDRQVKDQKLLYSAGVYRLPKPGT